MTLSRLLWDATVQQISDMLVGKRPSALHSLLSTSPTLPLNQKKNTPCHSVTTSGLTLFVASLISPPPSSYVETSLHTVLCLNASGIATPDLHPITTFLPFCTFLSLRAAF